MAESATPGSTTTKHPSVKDKKCPFCQQSFTSSSLGRHLDLYIREKNPKPPDDVHTAEEIRKIRGGITRRQARSSKRDGSISSSTKATPLHGQRSPSLQKNYSSAITDERGAVKTYWNTANWQATGVINDLPPTPREDQGAHFQRHTPPRGTSIKEELTRRQTGLEERDRGRAAEIALKEVLESLKAANARAHPSSPFDFNFFSLSLPQMYLKCLSPPPAFLSNAPTLHDASWTLDPPGTSDYEALRGWLHDKLHDWRRRRENLQFGMDGSQNHITAQTPISAENSPTQNPVQHEETLYYEHLSKSYHKWVELSAQAREKQWHHECAKAYAQEQERHRSTARSLEYAEQEIQLLRSQISQMNSNIVPTEFIHFPPATLPLTRQTMSYLPEANSSFYDSDASIAKWKSRIQSARSIQLPLPPASPRASLHQPTNSNVSSKVDFTQRATREARGSTRGQETDTDGGLEDAPGEEEDYAYDQTPEAKNENRAPKDQEGEEEEEVEVGEQPLHASNNRQMGLEAAHKGSEATDVDMESN